MYKEVGALSSSQWHTFGLSRIEGPVGLSKTVQLSSSSGSPRYDIYIVFTPNCRGTHVPALLFECDCLIGKDREVEWLALDFSADGESLACIPVHIERRSPRALLGTLVAGDVTEAFQCFLSGNDLSLSLQAPGGPILTFAMQPDPSFSAGRAKVAAALDRADIWRGARSRALSPIPQPHTAE
jgi:hypothetical protein